MGKGLNKLGDRPVKPKAAWLLGAVIVLALLGWAFNEWIRPPRVVAWNQAIQYDDFAFEVTNVDHRAIEGKAYTIVTLQVHNWAKRVDYFFDRSIVLIKDATGRSYRVSQQGQRAIDARRPGPDPCAEPLPAGSSCTDQLVFDLPEHVSDARLTINHGGWIGAILDDVLVGRKEIRLAKP